MRHHGLKLVIQDDNGKVLGWSMRLTGQVQAVQLWPADTTLTASDFASVTDGDEQDSPDQLQHGRDWTKGGFSRPRRKSEVWFKPPIMGLSLRSL